MILREIKPNIHQAMFCGLAWALLMQEVQINYKKTSGFVFMKLVTKFTK